MTEKHYKPEGFAAEIFNNRYTLHDGESFSDACDRVANHVAAGETDVPHWRNEFAELLKQNLMMPGGRIWYGSGRPNGQLLNCVSGDTLVHTRDGLIAAKDLAGKTVDTLSQDGVYRSAKWASYGKQELFTVEFENGDVIEATEGHQWVVTSKSGDKRVTTKDLEGQHVPLQHIDPSQRKLDKFSYRAGIQHGLVFGDGTINHDGKATILQFGDSRHLVTDYFERHTMQSHARYPEGVMYVGALSPVLKQEIPDINEVGASYVFGFIAGYIGSDGNVDDRGTVTLHSSKKEDLLKVRDLATAVGLTTVSLRVTRKLNPWDGTEAPLYCLRFAKSGIDPRLIIKNSHKEKLAACPVKDKRSTMKVVSVRSTERVEEVYCCEEPETNTWVAGHGYLTGNCFVIDTADSREGWGKTTSDMIVITGTGGGLGVNFSPIRPRGTEISGHKGKATGAVSLMEIIDSAGAVIKAGGGRRTALMFCLNLTHGDIVEFLDKKLDLKQLNNANVSVWFDQNPEDFFTKVRNNEELELKHQDRVIGKVSAKAIWDKIIGNALKNGEPGMLNGYHANKMSGIWYKYPLVSTNPCGEIFLAANDCCCLGALVLPRFVSGKDLDWKSLAQAVRTSVRFLDNVITVNNYPLPQIKAVCNEIRRIGLGIMGLHDMLLMLGYKYNSTEGLEFVDRVMKFIKHEAFDASTDLAKEKGAFPAFVADLYLKGGFAKTLKPSLRSKIKEHGIRNCALLTIAPTGTTSLVCDVTSGIEPMFSAAHVRRYRDKNDEFTSEMVIHPLFAKFLAEGKDISHFQGSHDLSMRDHFEMQRVCQRHIDNAVSKTVNVPQGTSAEELSDLYVEYFPELKGVTVYPEGSRENQPLTPVSLPEAIAAARGDTRVLRSYASDTCKDGTCDV